MKKHMMSLISILLLSLFLPASSLANDEAATLNAMITTFTEAIGDMPVILESGHLDVGDAVDLEKDAMIIINQTDESEFFILINKKSTAYSWKTTDPIVAIGILFVCVDGYETFAPLAGNGNFYVSFLPLDGDPIVINQYNHWFFAAGLKEAFGQ